MASPTLRRMLVISLGNPGDMRTTYHSAGHMVLASLIGHMPLGQSEFSLQRVAKINTLTSVGRRHTLLQSPCVMNISGPWVARAYQETLREHNLTPSELGVVVVHDDLEEKLGVVKIREWSRSPRGHNGLKSINTVLRPDPSGHWAKISVGIGRPDRRDKTEVSDFVLSQMPRTERGVLKTSAKSVFQALAQLEQEWGGETYPWVNQSKVFY